MKKITKLFALFCLLACFTCLSVLSTACSPDGANGAPTITYDTGVDGVTIPPLTASAGSKIYPPDDPERDGYRFEGWELDGEPFEFTVMPETDVTLKAVWTKLYTITFDAGEGATPVSPVQYAQGDTISLTQTPSRDGYKFAGWNRDGQPFTLTEMPAENITLTAEWKKAYTITFDTLTPEFTVAPLVEEAGAKISAPEVHRQGYFVKYWKLGNDPYTFDVMPEENITLTAVWEKLTNLPAMIVELTGKDGKPFPLINVNREDYVDSKITITNTDEKYELTSLKSEFRGRGNGSWADGDNKNGYKIKFDKKQSLFGRTANKHWVVIACTNFDDVTMSRNYLAYNMANQLFDGIEYSTQARWIDLYVNGEYRGVYLLCEHVRVGDGRVDIESDYLDESFENTGYLIEYDAYCYNEGEENINWFRLDGVNLKYGFTVHSPDPEDFMDEKEGGLGRTSYIRQVAYIKNYVTEVYKAALSGNYTAFAELADVDSFVDMYILHELFKNMDTGYSSFYLYKKPNGKLYAGPPWDFDATTIGDDGNGRGDRTPQGLYVATGAGSDNTDCELYMALYQTNGFKGAVNARWKVLSPQIKTYLDATLNDGTYAEYREAMGKNFAKWKYKSQTDAENGWLNDIKALKKWLLDRISWLDDTWK